MPCTPHINAKYFLRLQQVGALIKPAVGDVLGFLWKHMVFDLETIHTAIGRSVDDALVLVHLLLVRAIQVPHQCMLKYRF